MKSSIVSWLLLCLGSISIAQKRFTAYGSKVQGGLTLLMQFLLGSPAALITGWIYLQIWRTRNTTKDIPITMRKVGNSAYEGSTLIGQVDMEPGQVIMVPGQVVTGLGLVDMEPGLVDTGPGQAVTGPGLVDTGPGQVVMGLGLVDTGLGLVVTEPGLVAMVPGQVMMVPGQDRSLTRELQGSLPLA
jgi:hypothetical protein